MELGLKGKRAAVAAASTGLGYESARALIAEGAEVTICGRGERVFEAAAKIGARAFVADLADPAAATRFVEQSREALGGLDILVANAGGPKDGRYDDVDVERFLGGLSLNLLSTIAMCRAALPGMRAQKWGRVVTITSLSARRPLGKAVMTATARAGATAFLKSVSLEVAADGVTVNSVQPGYHDTERLTANYGDDVGSLAERVPAGRLGRAADFGQIVTFLCSEQAGYITGTAIPVDGGSYPGMY